MKIAWSKLYPKDGQPQGDGADEMGRQRYLASLNSAAPAQWISDHLTESRRLRGIVYIALKVLGDQAAGAELKAYQWDEDARLGGDQEAKVPLPADHPLCRLLRRPNRHDS